MKIIKTLIKFIIHFLTKIDYFHAAQHSTNTTTITLIT